jgi:dedicator of cytokinesis protein 3
MLRGLPNSNTNGTLATQATDILDTPGHRTARSRLSFLQRKPVASKEEREANEAVLVNGNGNGNRKSGRGRGNSEDGSERSRSKENRKSFFSGGGVGSIGRGRGRELSEQSEWVTESDFGTARRSLSEQRPKTSGGKSGKSGRGERGEAGGLSREGSVGSRVGSVRKRLSRLTLGKKTSKASVLVGSVAEEE